MVPLGWSIEYVQGMVLMLSPTVEADWQANISVEARSDREFRDLDEALNSIAQELRDRKAEFQELDRIVTTHPSGFHFARLGYTCREAGGTALTEWEIVAQERGEKRFFILFSTATELRQKYDPIFDSFLESFTLATD